MATDQNRLKEESVQQQALLDESGFLKEIVERVLQQLLEAQMDQHIGAAPYERSESRTGQRNGYKPRMLRTRVGTLNLLVPQDREGTFSTSLFARYQRNEKALVLALMEMYVEGVSTRKVGEVTEELCGTNFSKSTVSRLSSQLDGELEAWRNRPLDAQSYPYLFVDARYEKVRVGSRVISQGVLIAKAVRDDGFREIVAVEVADTESEATYQDLFRNLKSRGLSGVELVISDDHEGLKAAVDRHFQGASWQRCQVHFSRNLTGMVARDRRKELAADLRAIFAAPDKSSAQRLAREAADRWTESHSKVAEQLEENIEQCLSCLAFPQSHQRRIRNTNGLERFNQEVRRRSRVVRIFPNRESCLRLVSALAAETSEEWITGKRYLNMAELYENRSTQTPAEQEVITMNR